MLIFTQFQTAYCLRIEMSSVWKLGSRATGNIAFHREKRKEDQWCVRVIFVESESQALRVRVILNFFEWSQRHDFMSRVTRTVESLRVIGLQARVIVESHEISRYFYGIFLLWNGVQHAIKWRPISYKMVPNMLWNGAQKVRKWCPMLF